jgi:asparagine synthase (glutamine-hydrolysing)
VWFTEKPVLRTAPAPLFILSSLVRKHGYKVVVTGEGSDEMLGGYDIFKEAKIRRFWAADPSSKMRPRLLKKLYPYLPGLQSQSPAYLQAFFHVKPDQLSDPFYSHLPRWDLTAKLKLFFSESVRSRLKEYDVFSSLRAELDGEFFNWDAFCQAQYLEAQYLLPGYILSSQGDRVAMAHSVEGRFPFLDHRLVGFAARVPPRLKMKALNEKYILKLATQDLIPRRVLLRPKQPYRAPEARSFFAEGAARHEYASAALSQDRLKRAGIFNPEPVQKLVGKAKSGRVLSIRDNMALVGILSTQLVFEQFIDSCNRLSRG